MSDTVTVQVRLSGQLGSGRRSVQLPAGATVDDLVAALAVELGYDAEQLRGAAVAIGGEIVGRTRLLRDGEALALVLPVAGG